MGIFQRWATAIAGVLGFAAVALGAFGAHGLKDLLLAHGTLENWRTAASYQLVHAVALLVVSRIESLPRRSAVAACWTIGILLFSGSLYLLSVGGPRWLGPVTPVGGVALLAGWALVTWDAVRHPAP